MSAAGARLKGQDESGKEAQKKGEVFAKEVGASFDRTVCQLYYHQASLLISAYNTVGRQRTWRNQRSR